LQLIITGNVVPHASPRATRQLEELENDSLSPLFLAVVESVEEALYNSLTRATTVTRYRSRTLEAIPIDRLEALLAGSQR
jgi:D-aminopeptidase